MLTSAILVSTMIVSVVIIMLSTTISAITTSTTTIAALISIITISMLVYYILLFMVFIYGRIGEFVDPTMVSTYLRCIGTATYYTNYYVNKVDKYIPSYVSHYKRQIILIVILEPIIDELIYRGLIVAVCNTTSSIPLCMLVATISTILYAFGHNFNVRTNTMIVTLYLITRSIVSIYISLSYDYGILYSIIEHIVHNAVMYNMYLMCVNLLK